MAIQTEDNDFRWVVHEASTDQIIDTFIFEDEAQEYCEFLEEGGAFNGFTPTFMLNKVEIPMDINDMFQFEIASDLA
jgi:hypothetical protein